MTTLHIIPRIRKSLRSALVGLVSFNVASVCLHSAPDVPDAASAAREFPQNGAWVLQNQPERLPSIAAKNRWNVEKLRRVLGHDADVSIGHGDRLLFGCKLHDLTSETQDSTSASVEAIPGAEAAALSSTSTTPPGTPAPADAFKLHSLPGARLVIYLDFNGHTTTNTIWNLNYGTQIVSGPFDLDGNPGTFSQAERQAIIRIWQDVVEDYAPFQVDVTTEDPGVEAIIRTDSADLNYGVRVIISPTSSWYSNPSAGGVAYSLTFGDYKDTGCFVFQRSGYSESTIATACSHEVGHTVNLSHDGTSTEKYYRGHANWLPIMGSGTLTLSQWSKGEYADANNTEDDIAIIASSIPLLSDDYGSTLATASPIAPRSYTVGNIERRTDIDFFRVDCGAGEFIVDVDPLSPNTNLHKRLRVYDSAGTVLHDVGSSSFRTSWSYAANLSAGTYYISVEGVGYGDPLTTGYTDYGSLGEYLLTVIAPPATLVDPLARWNFEYSAGDTATGGTAANNATLVNGPTYDGTNKVIQNFSLKLSAASQQYASVPDQADLNPTSQITISAWIRPADLVNYRRVLQKGATGSQYRIETNASGGGKFCLNVGGVSRDITIPNGTFAVGNWYQVVGTYDGATVRCYVNGASVGTPVSVSGSISTTTGALFIGARQATETVTTYNWNGNIEDVRIYGVGFTPQAVTDLYYDAR